MMRVVKEWGALFLVIVTIVVVPLVPLLAGVLAIHFAGGLIGGGLRPIGQWGFYGWLLLAWIMMFVLDTFVRFIVRYTVLVRVWQSVARETYKRVEEHVTGFFCALCYVMLFCIITDFRLAVVATVVLIAVSALLSKVFDD